MEQKNNSPFLAFTRICLNNWHYISRKILSLNKEINFFTGHSGSGKSTVIDAMPIRTDAASLTRLLLMTRTVA